jgi:hypothetical protein
MDALIMQQLLCYAVAIMPQRAKRRANILVPALELPPLGALS